MNMFLTHKILNFYSRQALVIIYSLKMIFFNLQASPTAINYIMYNVITSYLIIINYTLNTETTSENESNVLVKNSRRL